MRRLFILVLHRLLVVVVVFIFVVVVGIKVTMDKADRLPVTDELQGRSAANRHVSDDGLELGETVIGHIVGEVLQDRGPILEGVKLAG